MIFVAIAIMSVASIVSRALFSKPIQGDYELVQAGCAVFVAMCLPICQMAGANIIVDFFTARAAAARSARLDALGAFLLALVMTLVAWRIVAGTLSIRRSRRDDDDPRLAGLVHVRADAARCRADCGRWLLHRVDALVLHPRAPCQREKRVESAVRRRGAVRRHARADGVARADRDRDVHSRRDRLRRAVERGRAALHLKGALLRASRSTTCR